MFSGSLIANEVLHTVRGIWKEVSNQIDLSPHNSIINRGLTRLVQQVMSEAPHVNDGEKICLKILKDEGVCTKIRDFCQDCEYQMECFWANKIIAAGKNRN